VTDFLTHLMTTCKLSYSPTELLLATKRLTEQLAYFWLTKLAGSPNCSWTSLMGPCAFQIVVRWPSGVREEDGGIRESIKSIFIGIATLHNFKF